MSFWGDPRHALLLVELIQTGEVRRRRVQEAAWATLLELGWARRTRRQGVLALDEKARRIAEETLQHAWPDWSKSSDSLPPEVFRRRRQDSPTCSGGTVWMRRADWRSRPG